MTSIQLPVPSTSPEASARRGGLIAWGVVLIVIGTIAAVVTVVMVLDTLRTLEASLIAESRPRRSGGASPRVIGWTELVGVLTILSAGVAAVWTGIASCLARRWVRPVIVVASIYVIVFALLAFIELLLTLPGVMQMLQSAQARAYSVNAPNSYSILLLYAIRGSVIVLLGVVLPYIMFRFYLSERTARVLNQLDPRLGWTDRCPIPVLGWAGFAALMAVSLLLSTGQPALPVFVVVLKGTVAIMALSALAVLLLWGAWMCYRIDRAGWILTLLLLLGLRVSHAVYLWIGGEPKDLLADAAAAAELARAQESHILPEWLPAVLASLECAIILAVGLWMARWFAAGYRTKLPPPALGRA